MADRDDLAYGEDYRGNRGGTDDYQGGDRGLIGDTFNKLRDKYHQSQQTSSGQYQQPYGQVAPGNQSAQYAQSTYPVSSLVEVESFPFAHD